MMNNITDRFLMVSQCGPSAYDLETETPDDDRAVMVLQSDFPGVPEDRIVELSEIIGDEGKGYFAYRLDRTLDLIYLAGLVHFCPKPPIGGNNERLVTFWTKYHADMLDIAPSVTYDRIMCDVNHCISHRETNNYAVAARNIGLMMCRHETGRMIHAVKLNGLWRERYFAIRNGEAGVDELMDWYDAATTKDIKDYFDNQPTNHELFAEWRRIANGIAGD